MEKAYDKSISCNTTSYRCPFLILMTLLAIVDYIDGNAVVLETKSYSIIAAQNTQNY
jgi:hypothetical protein